MKRLSWIATLIILTAILLTGCDIDKSFYVGTWKGKVSGPQKLIRASDSLTEITLVVKSDGSYSINNQMSTVCWSVHGSKIKFFTDDGQEMAGFEGTLRDGCRILRITIPVTETDPSDLLRVGDKVTIDFTRQ